MNQIKTPVTVEFYNDGAEVFLVDAEEKCLCSAISEPVAREISDAVNSNARLLAEVIQLQGIVRSEVAYQQQFEHALRFVGRIALRKKPKDDETLVDWAARVARQLAEVKRSDAAWRQAVEVQREKHRRGQRGASIFKIDICDSIIARHGELMKQESDND